MVIWITTIILDFLIFKPRRKRKMKKLQDSFRDLSESFAVLSVDFKKLGDEIRSESKENQEK